VSLGLSKERMLRVGVLTVHPYSDRGSRAAKRGVGAQLGGSKQKVACRNARQE